MAAPRATIYRRLSLTAIIDPPTRLQGYNPGAGKALLGYV